MGRMKYGKLFWFLLLGIGFVAAYGLRSIYQHKAPWYGPTFTPPDTYIKGPLSKDQGNTI